MANNAPPYFPFYAEDFVTGCLRGCMTPEQVGCYIMMMALQWLEQGPLPHDTRRFATQTGWDIRVVNRLFKEVLASGKYKQVEGGVTNARLEKEISKYVERVRKRGNDGVESRVAARTATQVGNEVATGTANGVANAEVSGKGNEINGGEQLFPVDETPTHARGTQKLRSSDTPKAPQGGRPLKEWFDEFWEAFPSSIRKHARGECERVFCRIVTGKGDGRSRRKTDSLPLATPQALVDAVRLYARFVEESGLDPQYIPSPVVWLNGGRWLDQPKVETDDRRPWWTDEAKVREVTIEQWRGSIRKHANGIWPIVKLGPPPGDPQCLVPRKLIAELKLDEIYDQFGRRRDGGH